MRISDWSSDVCSSDLGCRGLAGSFDVAFEALPGRILRQISRGRLHLAIHGLQLLQDLEVARRRRDRQPLVSGTRVSVRVDLGGSRIHTIKTYLFYHSDI